MQILEYHVFAGDAYEESDFDDHSTLHMVEGETVKVNTVLRHTYICMLEPYV